jgi:predicted MFS family arabinose efflux permease
MLGPLIGGITIDLFGLGAAFASLVVLLACSAVVFWRVTSEPSTAQVLAHAVPLAQRGDAEAVVRERGWQLLARSRPLLVVLAVTVVANLCYFAFIPLVPVIAENLGAGAAMAGVIGSTAGTVQLVAATALVAWPARRPGGAYAFGVALCLLCLGMLSYAPTIAIALLSLGLAGVGQALFGAMQATLPVAVVTPQERSAALGLLSTTIGIALPTGMLVLGVSSNLLGPRQAMLLSSLVGTVALAVVVLRNPQLIRHVAHSGGAYGTPSGSGTMSLGRESDPVATQTK